MTRFLSQGRYVLGKQLGVGGMGAVYDGADLAMTERVAIKVAHEEHVAPEVVTSYMAHELRAGRAIRHPNVVAILDGGCEGGSTFLVMERARGRDLAAICAEGPLSVRRVAAIVDQILDGLAAIHAAGYAHGDIKTDNVLVDGVDRVTIIDLGLACELDKPANDNEDERVLSGTPYYLAPELVLGGAKSIASDLYAVGVILYELLTGAVPFTGGSLLEVMRKHVEDDVVPPSLRAPELSLSPAFDRVVLRSLAKHPGDRYATADELRVALRAAARDTRDMPTVSRTSTSGPTSNWNRPDPPARPHAVGTNPPPPCDTLRGVAVDARDPLRRARRPRG
ncbi:MAG TPA: protein kinase [Kofleriaceae bacterium]|nr:protein kinase [Kofleriaceae bacterium]